MREWKNASVNQARASRSLHKASYAVVVSNMFPKGQKYLCIVRDVPVVHPSIVVHVVRYLRQGLVAVAGNTATPAERERKAARLLLYIRSEDFGRQMKVVGEALEDLREIQTKERQAHTRTWELQTDKFMAIEESSTKVSTRIEAIVEGTRMDALPSTMVG